MFRFDRTLVQPTLAALEQMLREAAVSPGSGQLLRWPLPSLADFRQALLAEREGSWQWTADDPPPPPKAPRPRQRGRGHARESRPAPVPNSLARNQRNRERRSRSVVAAVWWSDWIGRRHVRVVGCRRKWSPGPAQPLLSITSAQPAISLVYPNQAFDLTRRGKTRTTVACPCGMVGTAKALAWMGDLCGPCHDRREAGEVVESSPPRVLDTGTPVTSLSFSTCGESLASSSLGGVRVWNLRDGRLLLAEKPTDGRALSRARLSPDGGAVTALAGARSLHTWTLATGACSSVEIEDGAYWFDYLPDGRIVALSHSKAVVLDPASGRLDAATQAGPGRCIDRVHLAEDGSPIAMIRSEDDLTFRDILRGKECRRLDLPTFPLDTTGRTVASRVLTTSQDGNTMALMGMTNTYPNAVWLWDTASGSTRRLSASWAGNAARFTPDGRTLLTLDGPTLRAWDVATATERVSLRDGSGHVNCVGLSPCGRRFATGDTKGRVKLWPAEVLEG